MLRLGLLLLFALPILSGCAKPGVVAPVSGRISYRGNQIRSGLIVFTPDSNKGYNGPIVFSPIRGDGSYSLRLGDKEGATVGWYRVTVASLADNIPAPVSLIPEKYRDPELSQLSCEVKADRVNQLDFNLD